MKDHLSGYTWFYKSETSDSEMATDVILKCIAAFGCMIWIVSEPGALYTSEVMKSVVEGAHMSLHFTTVYCPRANGTKKLACRELI